MFSMSTSCERGWRGGDRELGRRDADQSRDQRLRAGNGPKRDGGGGGGQGGDGHLDKVLRVRPDRQGAVQTIVRP